MIFPRKGWVGFRDRSTLFTQKNAKRKEGMKKDNKSKLPRVLPRNKTIAANLPRSVCTGPPCAFRSPPNNSQLTQRLQLPSTKPRRPATQRGARPLPDIYSLLFGHGDSGEPFTPRSTKLHTCIQRGASILSANEVQVIGNPPPIPKLMF